MSEKVNKRRGIALELLIGAALTAVVIAVFAQVSGHEFINYDDNVYVTDNRFVQKGLTPESVLWAFSSDYAANWHPLTWLSHMLDIELYGFSAGGHHVTSLVLHILNTLLLFIVLRLMTGAVWRSAIVAILFAVHPLHVESVAWVAERKDVLSTLFWFLTVGAYHYYTKRPGWLTYLPVAILLALGLMAKPMLVTLPFVLLLLDIWPLRRMKFVKSPFGSARGKNERAGSVSTGLLIAEKLPLFFLAAASSVITFIVQRRGGAVGTIETFSSGTRIGNAFVSYAQYIIKTLWPSRLAIFYPHQGDLLPSWQAVVSALVIIGVTAALIRYSRRRPYLAVGWLWYLGVLVPVIGLVQVGSQAMADRYTYIPLVGLFIMAVWGIHDLVRKRQVLVLPVSAAAAMILLVLSIGSWRQVRHWRDNGTLYGHALAVTTNNYLAHVNMGIHLDLQDRPREAIDHYNEAIGIAPRNAKAYYNLAKALAITGETARALDSYARSLDIRPDYPEAHSNMGVLLASLKRYDEAEQHYRDALRLKSDLPECYINYGALLKDLGRYDEARKCYDEALRLDSSYPEAHSNLAVVFAATGKKDDAVRHYTEALRLRPDFADAHFNFANLYAREGETGKAIEHYRETLRIDPDYFRAHDNIAHIYERLGRIDEAVAHYRDTIRLRPGYAEGHFKLGVLLSKKGGTSEAVIHLKEAIRLDPEYERLMEKLIENRTTN